MKLMDVRGRSPLLVSVTFCAADCCPEAVAGKVSAVGESASFGPAAPVPLKLTVCVPAPSISEIVPVTAPVWVGAKVNERAQSLFAAIDDPHALAARANGAVTVTLVRGIAVLLAFSTVTGNAADVVLTCTCPKLKLLGNAVTNPALVPVPESGTEIWPSGMLASMVI